MNETVQDEVPVITSLTRQQRRVLGVLVEKAFTTPEYYPLTLKAVTTGCNQKSNRQPETNYTEDDVQDVLDELRELGLAAVIHTETGRTERFRHYMRRRFQFTEPQLAIMIELLLRGRQTLGELRARAGRMVPIDSLEQLRNEVDGLQQMNYVQSSGPLERRGVEVDHSLYEEREGQTLSAASPMDEPAARPAAAATSGEPSAATSQASATDTIVRSDASRRIAALEGTVGELKLENQQIRDDLESLKETVGRNSERVDQLFRDLGG